MKTAPNPLGFNRPFGPPHPYALDEKVQHLPEPYHYPRPPQGETAEMKIASPGNWLRFQ
jgi:hypothetical protein